MKLLQFDLLFPNRFNSEDSSAQQHQLLYMVTIGLSVIQILIPIVGATIRFSKYKNIGMYNKSTKWPTSYKLKISLQWLMIIVSFIALVVYMIIIFQAETNKVDLLLHLIELTAQTLVWILSISIYLFEYHRNLGHIWYMHPLFWWYSFFFYCFALYQQIMVPDLFGVNYIALNAIPIAQIMITSIMGVLSLVYYKEHNYGGRPRIPIDDEFLFSETYGDISERIDTEGVLGVDVNPNMTMPDSQNPEGQGFGVFQNFATNVSNDFHYNDKKKQVFFEIISKAQLNFNPSKPDSSKPQNPITRKSQDDFKMLERLLYSLNVLDFPEYKPLETLLKASSKSSQQSSFGAYVQVRKALNQWLKILIEHFQNNISQSIAINSSTQNNASLMQQPSPKKVKILKIPDPFMSFLGFSDEFIQEYDNQTTENLNALRNNRFSTGSNAQEDALRKPDYMRMEHGEEDSWGFIYYKQAEGEQELFHSFKDVCCKVLENPQAFFDVVVSYNGSIYLISVNRFQEICQKTTKQIQDFCIDFFQTCSIPALWQINDTIQSPQANSQNLTTHLEYLLNYILNSPLLYNQSVAKFLQPDLFAFTGVCQKAIQERAVSPDKVCRWIKLKCEIDKAETRIDANNHFCFEYQIQILRKNYLGEIKDWYACLFVSDLVMHLEHHSPQYFENIGNGAFEQSQGGVVNKRQIPEALLLEAEGEEQRNNSKILVKFLNEQVFKDPHVLASAGMRQFFSKIAVEYTQKEQSFKVETNRGSQQVGIYPGRDDFF